MPVSPRFATVRVLPDVEFHLLDAGHFALETHGGEISAYIREFLGRQGALHELRPRRSHDRFEKGPDP